MGLGGQYSAEGVTFNPNVRSLPIPEDCGAELRNDPAHARSGAQVAYSFCQAHGEDFDEESEALAAERIRSGAAQRTRDSETALAELDELFPMADLP